jgi:hypothetical protein
MNNKFQFISFYFIVLFLILGMHIGIASTGCFHVPIKGLFITEFAILIIAFLSVPIMVPVFNKEGYKFVNHFIMLTTIQFFSVLAFFGALTYTSFPFYRTLIVHGLILFVLLLIFQSILLVKKGSQGGKY